MNLPNRLTITRIALTFVIIILLLFPFDTVGLDIPKLFINEALVVDIKYLIAGCLFVIAAFTDFLDGYIARKTETITNYGKVLDAIADKVLVNAMLVLLTAQGFIAPIIPLIIIIRDIVVDAIKMISASNGHVVAAMFKGKVKTVCLMIGIILTLFYNLPFELWNLRISDFILVVGVTLSVISAFEYYYQVKPYIVHK